MYGLRAAAAGHDPLQVTVWLPEMETMQQLFAGAGYKAMMDTPLWIYEKRLKHMASN